VALFDLLGQLRADKPALGLAFLILGNGSAETSNQLWTAPVQISTRC
jgi:hypothetical protein